MSDESNEKETIPPPPGSGVPGAGDELDDDLPEQERTVMARVPDDLIAELQRSQGDEEPPRSAPPSVEGGLRQMFARNPMHIRDVRPTEAEGDALLDMLFDDATNVAPPPASASHRETESDPDEVAPVASVRTAAAPLHRPDAPPRAPAPSAPHVPPPSVGIGASPAPGGPGLPDLTNVSLKPT